MNYPFAHIAAHDETVDLPVLESMPKVDAFRSGCSSIFIIIPFRSLSLLSSFMIFGNRFEYEFHSIKSHKNVSKIRLYFL